MSGGGWLVQQGGLRAEGFTFGPVRLPCGIPCRTGHAAHLPSVRRASPGIGPAFLRRDGVHLSWRPFQSIVLLDPPSARSYQPGTYFSACGESRTHVVLVLVPASTQTARNRPLGIRFGIPLRTAADFNHQHHRPVCIYYQPASRKSRKKRCEHRNLPSTSENPFPHKSRLPFQTLPDKKGKTFR